MGLNVTVGRFRYYYLGGGVRVLVLFDKRAPVGGYREGITEAEWDFLQADAVRRFEEDNGIALQLLGRSGRHVCIEETPRNRRRYASLCRKAEAAARAFWDSMRPPVSVPRV